MGQPRAEIARNGMGDARSGHRRREKRAGCLHGEGQGLCQPRRHRPDAGNRQQVGPAGDGPRHDGDGRKGDELPAMRVEVTVALEKIYGEPIPGEIVDVEAVPVLPEKTP